MSGNVDSSGMQMSQCIFIILNCFQRILDAFMLLPAECEKFWVKNPVFCIFTKAGCDLKKCFANVGNIIIAHCGFAL